MSLMSIGEVARITGLAPSAIRYYERSGLVQKPLRLHGQRRYSAQAVARLRIVRLARDAGFTIAETRGFLTGFPASTAPSARWRDLADRKIRQIDSQMRQAARMKALLGSSFRCECRTLDDCERAIAETRPLPGESGTG